MTSLISRYNKNSIQIQVSILSRTFSIKTTQLNYSTSSNNSSNPNQNNPSNPTPNPTPTPTTSSSSSFFTAPPPKSQRPPKPPLSSLDPSSASYRHRSFYSEILPPFLRVLAYGSASYFALHLTWNLLNNQNVVEEREKELKDLQELVKNNREKVLELREKNQLKDLQGEIGKEGGKSWWKVW